MDNFQAFCIWSNMHTFIHGIEAGEDLKKFYNILFFTYNFFAISSKATNSHVTFYFLTISFCCEASITKVKRYHFDTLSFSFQIPSSLIVYFLKYQRHNNISYFSSDTFSLYFPAPTLPPANTTEADLVPFWRASTQTDWIKLSCPPIPPKIEDHSEYAAGPTSPTSTVVSVVCLFLLPLFAGIPW